MHGVFETKEIPPLTSRNATWKPRSLGILQCESYFPLSMIAGSLCLELTFADDPKSGLNTTSPKGSLYNVSDLVWTVDVLAMDPSF